MLPDIPHLLQIVGLPAFGTEDVAAVHGSTVAVIGHEPASPSAVEWMPHNMHCILHSAIVMVLSRCLIGGGTVYVDATNRLVVSIVIDVSTHSVDDYAPPMLWPIARQGFNCTTWCVQWFEALDCATLVATSIVKCYQRSDSDGATSIGTFPDLALSSCQAATDYLQKAKTRRHSGQS